MKPAPFTYHRPATITDALALLAEHAPHDGRVLAGGQSLVPIMAFRLSRPAHLIDINNIAELSRVTVQDGALCIGAGVRHAAFERGLPAEAGVLAALLAEVVSHIAHAPIRTRGTFCGSLAHADPASEWCLVAATLGATLVARSASGTRSLSAEEFFAGVMSTSLQPDELLAEARMPLLADDARFGFAEFNRRAGDFAIAMSLCVVRLANGLVSDVRIGVGGAEALPRRIAEAESILLGRKLDSALLDTAAAAAAAAIDPLEDAQTSAQDRRELAAAMVRRALGRATGMQA
jgi:carbon-monoxide dehydrogenase medium subunit